MPELKIEKRKGDHVRIVLGDDVQHERSNGFDDVQFTHYALPELDFSKIDTSVRFLGRDFKAPFLVTGMTGGYADAQKINKDIAQACEVEGIAFGVGSQRPMIEKRELKETYAVRDVAPHVFLCGNIGGFQLKKYSAEQVATMVSDIDANALCIHLNPLQEMAQPEGDREWSGVLSAISKICSKLSVPVIVKEVGAGINGKLAKELENAGAKAIDVSGVGGTSWSAVESKRAGASRLGVTFWNWGLNTRNALEQCSKSVKIPLIASGGMRNGLEAAKAIRMGATLVGAAYPFIRAQSERGSPGVVGEINEWKRELATAMLLTRSKNLAELRKAELQQ